MAAEPAPASPLNVLIAGGGVAAVEAALALRDLAPDQIRPRLVAPNPEFVYRPMTVREPFSFAEAERYPLQDIARDLDIELIQDSIEAVDPATMTARGASGNEQPFDALILCLGARIRPRFEHAITIDDSRMDELLHGLIQDVEGGYVGRLAFVVPARMAWPMPIYELALMTAARAYGMSAQLAITIVTPEDAPLALFGETVSSSVAELLRARGVEVITSAYCEVPQAGHVVVDPGQRQLEFDRIVALPELDGPALSGVPSVEHGFIPVDPHCQVRGVERIYAAGDATDFPVKHGGIAAQQADTAAQAVAALVGVGAGPPAFDPVVHGVLLTGERPRYVSARITGGHGDTSQISDEPTWSPPTKIVAKYLSRYLADGAGHR